MEHEKRHTRVKILLFAVFTIFTLVFIGWIYRFYVEARYKIQEDTLEIDCSEYDFDIITQDLSNKGHMFEVRNTGHTTLSQLVIEGGNIRREINFTGILPKETSFIRIENLSSISQVTVYVKNCQQKGKTYELK
ncbi:hypothetical protein JW930_05570 [Candidatus Woesearchaeota archaeon]|nr:hypothetical protein [Candidatus Woesearchaeota archaeon]